MRPSLIGNLKKWLVGGAGSSYTTTQEAKTVVKEAVPTPLESLEKRLNLMDSELASKYNIEQLSSINEENNLAVNNLLGCLSECIASYSTDSHAELSKGDIITDSDIPMLKCAASGVIIYANKFAEELFASNTTLIGRIS